MRRWLAAYVRMHHERKVRDRLGAMGIECFLPVQEEIRQWSDRRKKVERILIPMLVFVRVSPHEQALPLTLPSVLRYLVLRGRSEPAVIPDEQMDRFRFMLGQAPSPVVFDGRLLRCGQPVRICRGPLAGLEGRLLTEGGASRLAVSLDALGYAHVEVDAGSLEPLPVVPVEPAKKTLP